jgi:cation transport regulator ChaC
VGPTITPNLYFAYGSNLNQSDIDRHCREKSRNLINLASMQPKPCIVYDYELVFNYYSTGRKGGAANITEVKGKHVEGVLFTLNDYDMDTIAKKEGAPTCYRKQDVDVTLRDGTVIKDVTTFVVCENKKKSYFTPPTAEYMRILIAGAQAFGLTTAWINFLQSIPIEK